MPELKLIMEATTATAKPIPASWRSMAYHFFGPKPLRTVGTYYYDWVARICCRKLLKIPGVNTVFLRGGTLSDCAPGLSDLDFTIVVQDNALASTLSELRQSYQQLKRRLWLPGEVLLADQQTWDWFQQKATPLHLICQQQKRYHRGRWKWETRPYNPDTQLKTVFSLALQSYEQALDTLCKAAKLEESSFLWPMLRRLLYKTLRFAQSTQTIPDPSLPLPRLLAKAFCALHQLAIQLPPMPTSPPVDIDSLSESQTVILALNEAWIKRFQSQCSRPFKLKTTLAPLVLLFCAPMEETTVESFFNDYLSLLRSDPLSKKHAILLLSPQIYRGFSWGWRGWSRGTPLEALSWLNPSQLQDAHWYEAYRQRYLSGLTDKITMQCITLPGELVYAQPARIVHTFRSLCWGTLMLATGQLTAEQSRIIAPARNRYPQTCLGLEYLSTHRHHTDWYALIPSVIREIRSQPPHPA